MASHDTSSDVKLARKILEEFDPAELPEVSPDQLPDLPEDNPPPPNPLDPLDEGRRSPIRSKFHVYGVNELF
ncbi:MAG: hypothetical protein WC663_02275 [Patescibacteria group bacterium]|jgi:hypothetical protein